MKWGYSFPLELNGPVHAVVPQLRDKSSSMTYWTIFGTRQRKSHVKERRLLADLIGCFSVDMGGGSFRHRQVPCMVLL